MREISNYIKNNEAFVFLNEEITNYYASLVSQQIYDYSEAGYDVTVKINTIGGSVYGGMNIIDAIIETESNTQVTGLAASMGLMIAAAGKKKTAYDYANGMAHAVSGGDDDDFTELTSNSLKTILKNKTKLSEDVINTLMSVENGETFFSAYQMKDMGIVDEVISTGKKVELQNKDANQIFEIYNKLNLTEKMEDLSQIKNSLSLADNASVERINEKVNELKNSLTEKENEAKTLEATNQELSNKVQSLETQIEEGKKAQVEELINKYEELGAITSENKDTWTELANSNKELAKKGLEQIVNSGNLNVHNMYNQSGNDQKKLSDMTQQEKEDLARNNPELYNKLLMK